MTDVPGRSRRFIAVTREGWYFIFILTFIVFGSVLRQMNLLFLLAGLLICPLILNWRFAMTCIFFVSVRRHVPRVSHAGQVTFVEMEVNNSHPRITCWSLVLKDEIRRLDRSGPGDDKLVSVGKPEEIEVVAPQVPPGGSVSVSYRCLFAERGRYDLGPILVSSSFPVGLVKASYFSQDESTVYVGPRLGQLTPVWHQRVRSLVAGSQANQRRRGIDQDEFYALRQWQSGDSLRWIHWRTTAKFQNVMVRQFDQQGDRDLAVVLDFWCDSGDEGAATTRLMEHAASAYATVLSEMDHWIRGQVITTVCAEETTAISGQVQSHVFAALTEKLAVMRPAANNQVAEALAEIAGNASQGTPIIVISTRPQPEFAEVNPQLESALSRVAWIAAGTDEMDELFQIDENQLQESITGLFASPGASSGSATEPAAAGGTVEAEAAAEVAPAESATDQG